MAIAVVFAELGKNDLLRSDLLNELTDERLVGDEGQVEQLRGRAAAFLHLFPADLRVFQAGIALGEVIAERLQFFRDDVLALVERDEVVFLAVALEQDRLLLDFLFLLLGADLEVVDGLHRFLNAHPGIVGDVFVEEEIGHLGRDKAVGVLIEHLDDQAQTDRDDLAVFENDLRGARGLGVAFLAIGSDEIFEIFSGETLGHPLDNGGALHDLDLRIQVLGGTNLVIHHALNLHDDGVATENLHTASGLINRGLAQGVNEGGGKNQEKHHDDIPDALTEDQQVVLEAALDGGLAVTDRAVTAVIRPVIGIGIATGAGAFFGFWILIHVHRRRSGTKMTSPFTSNQGSFELPWISSSALMV